MSPKGRSPVITAAVVEQIRIALAAGCYDYVAAAYAGISKETYYQWLKRGGQLKRGAHRKPSEEGEVGDLLIALSDASKKALADAEIAALGIIRKAGKTTWQAAAWFLERRFRDRWAQMVRSEVSGTDGSPIEFTLTFDSAKVPGEDSLA